MAKPKSTYSNDLEALAEIYKSSEQNSVIVVCGVAGCVGEKEIGINPCQERQSVSSKEAYVD